MSTALPALRSSNRILIVSTDPKFRARLLHEPMYMQGPIEVDQASSGAQALSMLETDSFDSLVLDHYLPDLHPEEIAEWVRRKFPRTEVSVAKPSVRPISTLPDPDAANVAVPIHPYPNPINDAPKATSLERLPGMVGDGRAMQRVYQLARLVAPRDTTVLVTGETGTGKELVARAIHQISHRASKPFIVVNCAAIPEPLIEAELFGHARGAFTGAVQSRAGRIHNAHGGTLFLDEIGELPLSMQAKLLRFLQHGEVQRLGSSDLYRVDTRVICATNVKLVDSVKQKAFRQDLYYRLAVFPIEVPPLRERTEDIGLLAESFLSDMCRNAGVAPKRLSASVVALLRQSQWLGNVRELQHAVERAFILAGPEAQLHVEHFSQTSDLNLLSNL